MYAYVFKMARTQFSRWLSLLTLNSCNSHYQYGVWKQTKNSQDSKCVITPFVEPKWHPKGEFGREWFNVIQQDQFISKYNVHWAFNLTFWNSTHASCFKNAHVCIRLTTLAKQLVRIGSPVISMCRPNKSEWQVGKTKREKHILSVKPCFCLCIQNIISFFFFLVALKNTIGN